MLARSIVEQSEVPLLLRIAVIPGDGVGPEVVDIGLRVLEAAVAGDPGFEYETVTFPWGSEHYLATGSMMDPDALDQLASGEADAGRPRTVGRAQPGRDRFRRRPREHRGGVLGSRRIFPPRSAR